MNKLRPKKFILRFFIVFLIHLIFIYGDYSMKIWEFNLRRIILSLIFICYWLIVWYIAEYFTKNVHKKQNLSVHKKTIYNYLLFFINFVFAFISAFGFNLLYRFTDTNIFMRIDNWSNVPIFNPELTMSLFSFYILFFTTDIFFTSTLQRKEDQIKMEKMKRENMKAQYLVLKSQLDPHFLFNSLSVLTSIIHTDINLAEEFILRLSKTLRYVIEKKELTLVPLKEEIRFVDDYFFLIRNRFENGIIFENSIEKSIIEESYIPPASLQLLIENAVKHNKFSFDEPLQIKLFNDKNQIIIINNINVRDDQMNSTNQGLQNLTQRFSYFSDSAVNIALDENNFIVSMPILKKSDYERFNF